MWILIVNTLKSQIIVLKKSYKKEKWFFQGEEKEVVKSYNYLGVNLSKSGNFNSHVLQKLGEEKAAINSILCNILNKNEISLSKKI